VVLKEKWEPQEKMGKKGHGWDWREGQERGRKEKGGEGMDPLDFRTRILLMCSPTSRSRTVFVFIESSSEVVTTVVLLLLLDFSSSLFRWSASAPTWTVSSCTVVFCEVNFTS